jgi:hypothetical protein
VCTCDPPPLGTCTLGSTIGYSNNGCGASNELTTFTTTGCFDLTGNHKAFSMAPVVASTESCTPSVGSPNAFEEMTLCGRDDPSLTPCGDGGLCVPVGNGGVCNVIDTADECAPGYAERGAVAMVMNDTRNCTCLCSQPVQNCDGTINRFDSDDCSGAADMLTVTDNDTCTNTSDTSGSARVSATWSTGPCAPLDTTGNVTFDVSKLCCAPP